MKRIVLAIITLLTLTACANSTKIDGKKVTYDELDAMIEEREQTASNLEEEIKEKEEKLKDYESQLSEILTEFRENKTKYERLEELADKEDEVNKSLKEKENKISSLDKDISDKQKDLEAIKDEISRVEGDLLKVVGGPIKVNAGYFYFGDDIEPGRYKVKPQGNSSGNFFVRGTKRVNIILGKERDSHVSEYTFEAFAGDELETNVPVELYPVE